MSILITNDDGIRSKGIEILASRLKRLGQIYVIAPDKERSAASHSLTLHRPLRIERAKPNYYSVDGTPADCVNIAINKILKKRPSLVVSGINRGPNLGNDITYSGTVAGAREGTFLGISSFAISLVSKNEKEFERGFKEASLFAYKLAKVILKKGLPHGAFLNVNFPYNKNSTPAGIKQAQNSRVKITRQGKRIYSDDIIEKVDPWGKKYYWIGNGGWTFQKIEESDIEAIENSYISVTPISIDLTNYSFLNVLKKWKL